MTPKEPDMRELDELVYKVFDRIINDEADAVSCLQQALTSGVLCEPLSVEDLRDLFLVMGRRSPGEYAERVYQAQMRRKT